MGRHSAGNHAATSAEVDPIRQSYTLSMHVTEEGAMHTMLGRMDLTTRKYSFTKLATLAVPTGQQVPLHYALRYVANLVEWDEETERYTI